MKDRLHILFLTGWYPSRVTPESGDFIQRHAEAVSLKNKVTVVHVKSDPKAEKKIEIIDTELNNIRTLIAYIKPPNNSFLKAFLFIKAFIRLLQKTEEFDLVHLNKLYPVGVVALFLKIFKGKKYLISEHYHIYHHPYNKKIGSIEKYLSKIITKNAQFICPVSDNLGKAMQGFGLKGNYKKIPNVIFTNVFTPKKNQNQKEFTLMHASSMSKVKNIEGILFSLNELQNHIPKFKFYLIGRDSEKFRARANEIGIKSENIEFIDQISQDELAAYYKLADVFLLFSNIETFSCVIYESFSSGTPVITTNVGGIKENFPDNYGFLIEKGNKRQLLESILKVHSNFKVESPNSMHKYVQKNFSSAQIATSFDNLYRQIV